MPPEVALLNNIKYEWLALVVIIYIVFKKPIEQFFNFIWFKITKKRTLTLEQYLETDQLERIKRQTEVDSHFDKIQAEVNRLGNKIIDINKEIGMLADALDNFEQKADLMDKVTLENTLFSDSEHVSTFRKLKAYAYLIAMGANGRIKMKGTELILQNKNTWLDVMDVTSNNLNFGKPEDKQYYDDVITEINRAIYDIRGKPYSEPLEKLESAD